MSVRTFEALGPMLRGLVASPTRCTGDVLLFGPRAAVELLLGERVEAVAPVEGVEHGARLTASARLVAALFDVHGDDALARRLLDVTASPAPGTVAVEWTGSGATSAVHLLVDAPPSAPAPAPTAYSAPGLQVS